MLSQDGFVGRKDVPNRLEYASFSPAFGSFMIRGFLPIEEAVPTYRTDTTLSEPSFETFSIVPSISQLPISQYCFRDGSSGEDLRLT